MMKGAVSYEYAKYEMSYETILTHLQYKVIQQQVSEQQQAIEAQQNGKR